MQCRVHYAYAVVTVVVLVSAYRDAVLTPTYPGDSRYMHTSTISIIIHMGVLTLPVLMSMQ